ncbi:arabinofuranosyltransferase, partial [Corynebacterium variabile]|uniref:arabinofuranosyltransferase n=1 Tax=Corynebacterium variabile TaxID=1727 RepID=UPI0028E1D1EC
MTDSAPTSASNPPGSDTDTVPDSATESTPATTPAGAPRPGALNFVGQVIGAGVLAALMTLAAWIVLARTHLPAFSNSNVTKALASAGAILVLAVLGLVIYRMLHPRKQGTQGTKGTKGT